MRMSLTASGRFVALFLFVMIASVAFAQLPTATILGVVKDASGAVMPGANLTARNVDTGQIRTAVSAGDGSFRFSALPVGSYELRAEHSGFRSAVRSGLTLTVTQEAVVNFTLDVGAVEQTVAVTAEAPLVNTTSGTLGGLVDEQKVADLPLNGRNYASLTLLQPGVQQYNINRGSTGGPQQAGVWYSSNGAPPRSNNYLLDGAIIQTANDTASAGVSQLALGIDGIREYRVVTNSFSAEYGMRMGSQVTIVSKSGTNTFHGSVFEYLRNSALDARNFFDYKTATNPRRLPAFTRNNFGGSFGGPIQKDKTFFFGVFEALRERLGLTTVSNVIPAAAKVDGGLVPQISPVVKPFLAFFPDANLPNNQLTFPYSQPTNENYGQVRADQTFSTNDTLFGRYTIDDAQQVLGRPFPQFKDFRSSRFQFATLSENHIFSPTLLNTARFSYSRTNVAAVSPSGIIGPQFSFVAGQETGNITIGGLPEWGAQSSDPSTNKQNVFSWSDDLFYTRGRHSLKFGALINRYQYYKETGTRVRGAVGFANITSFLLGQPSSLNAVTPGSFTDRTWFYSTLGFYVQDDLRVSSNFTVNVGLRYEVNTEWQEVRGHGSALRDILRDASYTLSPEPYKNNSLRNLSPRFGFAWDVRGNGKTALRGGFGLLQDIANLSTAVAATIAASPPFSNSSSVANPSTFTLPLFFPPSAVGKTLRVLDYHMQQPHILQYNLTVERQLPFQMALTLAYGGSRGFNLPQILEGNPTVPQILPDGRKFWLGNEPRMNPNWGSMELRAAAGDSWYNSLQFGLVKRLSKGLQFQSSYTWSKSLDLTGSQQPSESPNSNTPADPGNRRLDRAPTSFDATQNWRFNAIYHLPDPVSSGGALGKLVNGWGMTGILSLQTGYPYNPRVQTNRSRSQATAGGGDGFDRPDLVSGRNNGNIVRGGRDRYFDPSAFALQSAGFLGTAARNMIRGPGVANLDLSLVKDTGFKILGESGKLEFRAEFFNLLNRVNFGDPNMTVFAGRTNEEAPLATAGRITGTGTTARQIQLALKILF